MKGHLEGRRRIFKGNPQKILQIASVVCYLVNINSIVFDQ